MTTCTTLPPKAETDSLDTRIVSNPYRVLITGGAGFVGSNLAKHFHALGHTVVVLDDCSRHTSRHNLVELRNLGIYCIQDTIFHFSSHPISCSPPDVILHCAAQPSAIGGLKNPRRDFDDNIAATFDMLEFARQQKCAVIFWSSNKVYNAQAVNGPPRQEYPCAWQWVRDPRLGIPGFSPVKGISTVFDVLGHRGGLSIYGMTKRVGELMAAEYATAFGVPVIINRFSCLAGPMQYGVSAQGWAAWWIIAHMLGLPLKYIGWKGKQVRDVLFAPDICSLIEKQIKSLLHPISINPDPCRIYNVGGGPENAISLRQAALIAEEVTGNKVEIETVAEPRYADHCIYISNTSRVCNDFGWEPEIDLTTGFEQIYEWAQEHRDVLEKENYT